LIDNLLVETCIIKHRQEDSRDSFNQYDYWLEEDVPCLLLVNRELRKENGQAIGITETTNLYLVKEVTEKDRIIYDGYEYQIAVGGVRKERDIVSGNVEYYVVDLERTTAHPPDMVEIKRR